MSEILAGAEPESWSGERTGVLVLHGFTGSPHSVRGWAAAMAAAGHTVELPRLPGHGTTLEDLMTTGWDDWSATADAAYLELASRCDRVAVAGLSMGGTLTLWLAEHYPEIASLLLVNPLAKPQPEITAVLVPMLEAGMETIDSIGSDIAMAGSVELSYAATPLGPLATLGDAVDDIQDGFAALTMPVLLMSSPQDHVVPPASSEHLAAHLGGPVEWVTLERSYHVATLDHDAQLIEERSVEFLGRTLVG